MFSLFCKRFMLQLLNAGSLNGYHDKVYLGHEFDHTFYDFCEERVFIWEIKSTKFFPAHTSKLNV